MEILSLVAVFVTLVLLLYLLSMVWPPDSPWSPWWRTNTKRSRLICKMAGVTDRDVVYDLGCGDGTLLITAAKEFGARAVGVEIDPFRAWYAKLAALMAGQGARVKIVRKNFFDAEIGDATVVFMYLIPKALAKLNLKLIEELKPGTRVVTFVYRIDLPVVKEDLKNEMYLYEIPKKKK